MSVEKITRKDGKPVYRVRWREDDRNRSKTYSRREDARAADDEITRRKRLGTLAAARRRKETLDEFIRDTWAPVYAANLSPKTRGWYAGLYAKHIGPQLGSTPLRNLTMDRITGVARGTGSVRRWEGSCPPFAQVAWRNHAARGRTRPHPDEPRSQRAAGEGDAVPGGSRPLAPATVELMRAIVPPRDATLISVLAYAGLRPGEALGLLWGDIRERTILVERAVSLGEFGATKTKATRTVRMLAPMAQDLAEWRMRSGRPGDKKLVFPRMTATRGRRTTRRTGGAASSPMP